jgi:hypothetical protein
VFVFAVHVRELGDSSSLVRTVNSVMSLQVGDFTSIAYFPRIFQPLFKQDNVGRTNRLFLYDKDRIENDASNSSSLPRERLYLVVT